MTISNAQAAVIVNAIAGQSNALTSLNNALWAFGSDGRQAAITNNGELIVYGQGGDEVIHNASAVEVLEVLQAAGANSLHADNGYQMLLQIGQRADWLAQPDLVVESAGSVAKVVLGGVAYHVEGSSLVSAGRFSQAQVEAELAGDFDAIIDGAHIEFSGEVGQYSGFNYAVSTSENGVRVTDGVSETARDYSHADFLAMARGLTSADIEEVLAFVDSGMSIDKARSEATREEVSNIDVLLSSHSKADLDVSVYVKQDDAILSMHLAKVEEVKPSEKDLEYVASKDVVELVGMSSDLSVIDFDGGKI